VGRPESNLIDARRVAAPGIPLGRVRRVGFTTFIFRAYEDIVRYFFLTIAPPAVTTTLYLAVFGGLIGRRIGSVGGLHYMQYIAPGLIILPVIMGSYSQAGLSFVVAKIHRIIDEYLVSPQPGWMIVVSYVTGGSIRGILVGAAVAVVVLLITGVHVEHVFMTAGVLLLTSVVAALAGFINGVFASTLDQVSWVPSLLLAPLTYLGGVFYSLSLLPAWAQRLSRADPILYMVDSFRYGMLGVSEVRVGVSVLAMLLAAVALFGVAVTLMQRGVGIRD
jgi:ABC-2 type transport system permease protein